MSGTAQNLLLGKKTSTYTYIYKITNKEAGIINRRGLVNIEPDFLHSLKDSFLTDTPYQKSLAPGHYIKTYSKKNKQYFSYVYVPDYEVKVMNNNTDLCIQIYTLNGEIIPNARVSLFGCPLKFDEKTQCYTQKKSNAKGLLKVSVNDHVAYFEINRSTNNPWIKRFYIKTFYSVPLAYVWIPIRNIINVPVDGVRSLIRQRPTGMIYRINYFFRNLFRSHDKYNNNPGYMVFSKPKYMPGDTVKFKAYLLNKNITPYAGMLNVIVYNDSKPIKLTSLKPYSPGAFEYAFCIHDSLNLKIDRYYSVVLSDKNENAVYSSSFYYEDYLLKNVNLSLRTTNSEQFNSEKFSLFARATDDNELNIQDARMELTLLSNSITENFSDVLFIPDTLWTHKTQLKPSGETEISIPDSVFPAANFEYTIVAKVLTADNKMINNSCKVHYFFKKSEYEFDLKDDSVYVKYKVNNKEKAVQTKLTANDNFQNETVIGTFETPFSFKLNPFYKDYYFKNSENDGLLEVADENPQISCTAKRTADSVFFEVSNPRKLNFVYSIYRYNTEISRGSGKSLAFAQQAKNKFKYFISLRYLWGGEVKSQTFSASLADKQLNVHLVKPDLIYPGQKTKLAVYVTDYKGKPVEGVDLTAYSLTNKFNYSAPVLPYFGKRQKDKDLINNFRINENEVADNKVILDYEKWKKFARLDTIEYYKFRYTENGYYKSEFPISGNLTQFAPFVVDKKGNMKDIQIIFVDNKPVYFAWSGMNQPYTFNITAGTHKIRLRLKDRSIYFDNETFRYGHKTIICVREDIADKNIRLYKESDKLSYFDRYVVKPYIYPYINNYPSEIGYIKAGDDYIIMNNSYKYANNGFAGPVIGEIESGVFKKFSQKFDTEENFTYEVTDKVVKMREMKDKFYPYMHLSYFSPEDNFTDKRITKDSIENVYQNKEYENLLREIDSHCEPVCRECNNSLIVNMNMDYYKKQSVIILLINQDNINNIRVCRATNISFDNLIPGFYKLFYYLKNGSYCMSDLFEIKGNGKTYIKANIAAPHQKDLTSFNIRQIIENKVLRKIQVNNEQMTSNWIKMSSFESYSGIGNYIKGKVISASDKQPIIGASVFVPGTKFGTISDINGDFSMKIPMSATFLTVSYIGCKTEKLNVDFSGEVLIELKEDEKRLEEVVVLGYGVQKRRDMTASISCVSTDYALQGKIAGIDASSNSGLRIRGLSSVSSDAIPLYIVDGKVFDGDINNLDQSNLENIEVIKDQSAIGLYGARAANGVVMITTKGNSYKTQLAKNGKGADFDQNFIESLAGAKSLRNNFSDVAFWQPRLVTDKEGKAEFEVTFPDDITKWDAFVLAMNGKRQSGQTSTSMKSYKPLMGQLAIPEFLTKGDSCKVIGKSLNYLPDSVRISTWFDVNGKTFELPERYCKDLLIDTFTVLPVTDTLSMKYMLKRSDGYSDGEQRNIPIVPQGLEQTKGSFKILDKDSVFQPEFDKEINGVTLYADAGYLDVLEKDISSLIKYKYNCNEQIASKLYALLAEKTIYKYKNLQFKHENEIIKLIKLLKKNQQSNGLWSWFYGGEIVHYQFSLHILQMLAEAKKQGFDVDIDTDKIAMNYVKQLEKNQFSNISDKLAVLSMLKTFDCAVDYKYYLNNLDTVRRKSLNNKLQLIEIRQLCHLPFDTTIIKTAKQTTILGNVFYKDEDKSNSFISNELQNTLLAYRIIRNLNPNDSVLSKIRLYLLEIRQRDCYRNTYETARILQTILPDILNGKKKWEKSTLSIQGSVNKTITEFPFSMVLSSSDKLTVTKTGMDPIYITAYQHYWNPEPVTKSGDLKISTYFEHQPKELKAGNSYKLLVVVDVKKDAEYVMIDVPIPASCVYGSKNQEYYGQGYREYYKTNTNIYIEKLKKGTYTYEINLIPRFGGNYILNPAKVELMYFPTFNANNEIKKVIVK